MMPMLRFSYLHASYVYYYFVKNDLNALVLNKTVCAMLTMLLRTVDINSNLSAKNDSQNNSKRELTEDDERELRTWKIYSVTCGILRILGNF